LGAATGLKVHRNLDYALEDRNLPALVVISGDDQPDNEFSPVGLLDQQMDLQISILMARSPDPETTVDPHEAQIHARLVAATSFDGVPAMVRRIAGSWAFDLGDTCARHLGYRVSFRTSYADLES
jgi:hypothetical protein